MSYYYYTQAYNYFMVPLFNLSQCSLTNQVKVASNDNDNKEIENEAKKTPIKLNITREDLMNVGYNRNYKLWSEQQDEKLKSLIKKQKMDWKQIGRKMGNRTSKMCYSRYRRLSYESMKKWTSSEELFIMEFVNQYGMDSKKIAQTLKSRTPRQIQQHYEYCLKSNFKKSQWTVEEDLLLIKLLQKYGAQWKSISNQFQGRSQSQLKNRYFSRLLKISNKKLRIQEKHATQQKTKIE